MKRIVVAAAVLVAVTGLAGCGGKSKPAASAPTPTAVARSTPSPTGLKLPKGLVDNFLKACTEGQGQARQSLCNCILVKLAKTASRRELAILGTAGRRPPASTQRKLKAATTACTKTR